MLVTISTTPSHITQSQKPLFTDVISMHEIYHTEAADFNKH